MRHLIAALGCLIIFFHNSGCQSPQERIIGIYDIDTRKLVKHIRSKGVMNCIISTQNLDDNYLESELKKVPSMKNLELASYVTTKKSYFYGLL